MCENEHVSSCCLVRQAASTCPLTIINDTILQILFFLWNHPVYSSFFFEDHPVDSSDTEQSIDLFGVCDASPACELLGLIL